MANFKRGRSKKQRAGCLYCKTHKCPGQLNGWNAQTRQEQKARLGDRERRSGLY